MCRRLMKLVFVTAVYVAASAVAQGAGPNPTDAGKAAPRIWDDRPLQDWAIPVAKMRPKHYTEAEYYAAPADNLRSYPVYHPDREPSGYLDSLRSRGPQPLLELGKARTREEWIEVGSRVWDELDLVQVRTSDARIIDYVRSREALKKYPVRTTKDGILFDFRWVVDKGGELKLSVRECSACHSRVTASGTVIAGSQGNFPPPPAAPMSNFMFSVFSIPKEPGEEAATPAEGAYAQWGVPWLPDDIHKRLTSMSPAEIQAADRCGCSRDDSPVQQQSILYFTTKMPSLIGVQHSRYLDATGTHRNRGPEDIARLCGTGDDCRRRCDRPAQVLYRLSAADSRPVQRRRSLRSAECSSPTDSGSRKIHTGGMSCPGAAKRSFRVRVAAGATPRRTTPTAC